MRRIGCLVVSLASFVVPRANAESLWPILQPLYEDLHAHPELSFQETATAAKMAERLKALGFDVTTGVGKTGVVGIMKNGAGPTVILRTEMDGLPVEEKTGLPFASKATGKNPAGETVAVMHACGHDAHMTAWVGAATTLANDKKSWHGTLMMVAQPAEENGSGAKAMLEDGLLTRFPRPDFAIAIHDNDALAAGTVGIKAGPIFASADSVTIVVYGKGGHGARPHMTIDPVVIAAKIVLSLQTLVSRENDPFDPAVVTVGSIHGGTKHNIIPDEVRLQLTVRAYKAEVRDRLLRGIERIARAEATAAQAPKPPDVTLSDTTPVTVNDAALAARVGAALRKTLGEARVSEAIPIMAGEDFSRYARRVFRSR
jgi:hippurate hydrolase